MTTPIERVFAERNSQDAKWGTPQHRTNSQWLCIILEELGEAAQAMLQGKWQQMESEIVQVAASALCFLEERDVDAD